MWIPSKSKFRLETSYSTFIFGGIPPILGQLHPIVMIIPKLEMRWKIQILQIQAGIPPPTGTGGLGSSAFPQCLYKLLAKLTILGLENGTKNGTFFGKFGKTMVFYT